MGNNVLKLADYVDEQDEVERDPEVQQRRAELAEADSGIVDGVMLLLRAAMRDLLKNETPDQFKNVPARMAKETARQLRRVLEHAGENDKVRRSAERVAIDLDITDEKILEKIERTAAAIYKAMLRMKIEDEEVRAKAEEVEEGSDVEPLAMAA